MPGNLTQMRAFYVALFYVNTFNINSQNKIWYEIDVVALSVPEFKSTK